MRNDRCIDCIFTPRQDFGKNEVFVDFSQLQVIIEEKKIRDGWGIYDDGVEKYEGEFANDLYNGRGKITFASGASYEGDFYENMFHGNGTYIQPNNTGKYEGAWEQGKWHGFGVYVDADGVEWKGDFFMGKYESPVDVDFGEIKRKEIQLGRSESKMEL